MWPIITHSFIFFLTRLHLSAYVSPPPVLEYGVTAWINRIGQYYAYLTWCNFDMTYQNEVVLAQALMMPFWNISRCSALLYRLINRANQYSAFKNHRVMLNSSCNNHYFLNLWGISLFMQLPPLILDALFHLLERS